MTTPGEDHRMYTQQRDEYLESVCEMAVRKMSIITIFGPWSNGTMKIDHYQLGKKTAAVDLWGPVPIRSCFSS